MFVYLAKKISIPNNVRVHAVNWNAAHGWVSCGGGAGMLRVIQLEPVLTKRQRVGQYSASGASASKDLSVNQTLDGFHNGSVCVVTWNEKCRKLTTSDEKGLIIVWMLHKGLWYEEMINNRNKSAVKDMKWTGDGEKICIAYQDGFVIVGMVDGSRLWGKELEAELHLVEWSPNGNNILFATGAGDVMLYDTLGNYMCKLPISAASPGSGCRVVGLQWYNGSQGYIEPNVPCLAICYDSGHLQIMRHDADEDPVLIDTQMQATSMRWSTQGAVLAVAGVRRSVEAAISTDGSAAAEKKDTHMVQFYDPFGRHLRTLKVPGAVNSLSWEGGSLRLALGVDTFIYFAHIRPAYHWGYLSSGASGSGCLVYAYNKPDRAETCVMFWDTVNDVKEIKYVKKLLGIRSAGELCVFAQRSEDEKGEYCLMLCNAIGNVLESKFIDVEPRFLAMTRTHVVVASADSVYIWHYRNAAPPSSAVAAALSGPQPAPSPSALPPGGREYQFFVDEANLTALPPRAAPAQPLNRPRARPASKPSTADPICAVAASPTVLVVGRASGSVLKFSLPSPSLEQRLLVKCRPAALALNCNSKRMSVVDVGGVLTLFEFDALGAGQLEQLAVQRKDVWDLKWSSDNPELFACMEKTRMYIVRGVHPEEPVNSYAYLCEFSDLTIKAALLDDIMADADNPEKDMMLSFDTKTLRDTRTLLDTVPIIEAYTFVEDNPHPRLWRLVAECALQQLNLSMAEKAFVRCQDYQGIQFVKRLRLLPDPKRQRAEVAAYSGKFDEAEDLFLKMGQKELAVELRARLGDYNRVVQLIEQGGAGDDRQLVDAFCKIGDYYADRHKWDRAYKYYVKSNNLRGQAHCAYALDRYDALCSLMQQLPDRSDLLKDLGEKLMSVGLCAEAVSAFLKAGDSKAAVDCCVILNQWDSAIRLAEQYHIPQIDGLLTKYAGHLLQKDKVFQAVDLYRRANKHSEAALLLSNLARAAVKSRVQPLRAKQLFVMSAMEVDMYRRHVFESAQPAPSPHGASAAAAATAKLQSLLEHEAATGVDRSLEAAWRGAEAVHFLLLSQRQLYSAHYDAALKTAYRLTEYEDILEPRDVYGILALAAFYNGLFGLCSRAISKLEHQDLPAEERHKIKKLALQMFTRHPPIDSKSRTVTCPVADCHAQLNEWETACSDCGQHFAACVLTGRPILSSSAIAYSAAGPAGAVATLQCRVCKHRLLETEARHARPSTCPLCHAPLSQPIAQGPVAITPPASTRLAESYASVSRR